MSAFYIRQGSHCLLYTSRNFYVGKELTQEDIKAKFENGVLTLNVPKKEALPQREEERYISIL